MNATQKRNLLKYFEADYMGRFEVLDAEKLKGFDFDSIPNPCKNWNDPQKKENKKALGELIVDPSSYYFTKDTRSIVVKNGHNTTIIDLTLSNLTFGLEEIYLSYGTEYKIFINNGIVDTILGYYPSFRKDHARKRASDFIKDIETFLTENGIAQ